MGWPSAIAPPFTFTLLQSNQLLAVGQGLGRERLVDFDEVEVVDFHIEDLEEILDREDRTVEEHLRLGTAGRVRGHRASGFRPFALA